MAVTAQSPTARTFVKNVGKAHTGAAFKARKCRRVHDLVMFVVEVPVTTHVDSPPWICIMRNYTCANSAHTVARKWEHTRAHTGIPREYNDRRLFIPPLTSAAPRTPRRVNYHANSVNANSMGVITRKDVDIMESTC